MRNAKLGKIASADTRERMSQSQIINWENPEFRNKVSLIHKEQWKNPEYRSKVVTNTLKALNKGMNTPEKVVFDILNELYPNEWKWVGDGDIEFGGKVPDFIHRTRNLIIEHFGIYHHRIRPRCYEETEKGRIEHFKKYGYETLIIWNDLLYEYPDKAIKKIIEFCDKKNENEGGINVENKIALVS
jgi:very-short-patch-repair endonuclease